MAKENDIESLVDASQQALLDSIESVVKSFENDLHIHTLTCDQVYFIISEFRGKKAKIVFQDKDR